MKTKTERRVVYLTINEAAALESYALEQHQTEGAVIRGALRRIGALPAVPDAPRSRKIARG